MKYAVKKVKGKDLKEGDEVWLQISNHTAWLKVTKENNFIPSMTFLVRVPSSPVMSFEEFKAKYRMIANSPSESQPVFDEICQIKYEGYLIGTRSIVPEIDVEKIMEEYMNGHWLKVGHLGNRNAIASGQDFKAGIEACINWLRSQINK